MSNNECKGCQTAQRDMEVKLLQKNVVLKECLCLLKKSMKEWERQLSEEGLDQS